MGLYDREFTRTPHVRGAIDIPTLGDPLVDQVAQNQVRPTIQSDALKGVDTSIFDNPGYIHALLCKTLTEHRDLIDVMSTMDFTFLYAMTEPMPFHLGYAIA